MPTDEIAPWDPFWEYVLGESDDDEKPRRWRANYSRTRDGSGNDGTVKKAKGKRFWNRRSGKKDEPEKSRLSNEKSQSTTSWGLASAFDSFVGPISDDESEEPYEQRDDDTISSKKKFRERFWSRGKRRDEDSDLRELHSETGSTRKVRRSHRRTFSDESDSLFDLSVDESAAYSRKSPKRSQPLSRQRGGTRAVTGNPFEDRLKSNSCDSDSQRSESVLSYSDDESEMSKGSFIGNLLHPFLGGSSGSEDSSEELGSNSEDSFEEVVSNLAREQTTALSRELVTNNDRQLDDTSEIRMKYSLGEDERVSLSPEFVTAQNTQSDSEIRLLPIESDRDVISEQALYPVPILNKHGSDGKPKGALGKIVCGRVRKLTPEMLRWQKKTGNSVNELSDEELAALFPKLRVVSDADTGASSSVLGKGNGFERQVPAHLQLPYRSVHENSGPHSLYEYDYESTDNLHIVYDSFSSSARTVLATEALPTPRLNPLSPDEVIIQVEASTISISDCLIRRGEWWGECDSKLPNTPGVDATGMVFDISEAASKKYGLAKGDRVTTLVKWGGNARFIRLNANDLVKVSPRLDPAQVSCLVETYLTAFQVTHYGQSPGKRFKNAALRGKSLFILGTGNLNLLKAIADLTIGAKVKAIYSPASVKRKQQLSSLGIQVLPIEKDDWFNDLHGKIDLIISMDHEVLPLHYSLLSSEGEVVIVSRAEKVSIRDPALRQQPNRRACSRLLAQQKSRTYIYDIYWEWDGNRDRCQKDLDHLLQLLERGRINPHVIDRIPLSKVPRAQELIETRVFSGYLVCEPWLVTKARAIRL